MKKTIPILIFIFVFFSCATKIEYKFDSVENNDGRLDRALENANYLKEGELWIILYSGFYNDKIQIYENETKILDSVISTARKYPRVAKVLKVHKQSGIKIISNSFTKPILIKKGDLLNYKCVYVSKHRNHIEVFFTNNIAKINADESIKNSKAVEKYLQRKIKDSIRAAKKEMK